MKNKSSGTKEYYCQVLHRVAGHTIKSYKLYSLEQLGQAFQAFIKTRPIETKQASSDYMKDW